MTFDFGVKVTQNVAQYPLHHVTYAAPKFEVATSNGLGGDALQPRKLAKAHLESRHRKTSGSDFKDSPNKIISDKLVKVKHTAIHI